MQAKNMRFAPIRFKDLVRTKIKISNAIYGGTNERII